ncbi:WD40 repeat-like protein [Massarina eburnea CBS 473.64]|uniref:WD40 repeat-like protein n=1 Tax=Massarina eburnea CBS 473.64 TaxID=1395130 RepID=A0A6A6RMF5_9PLEO|nr:WD40 repeat-like protein [Massarina eburnea CBS 473.64]
MYDDVDDEGSASNSCYTTPPLSPSKTVSTEEWLSPKSPVSPRKTRSCLFFRDVGDDSLLPTPPDSPTKIKDPTRFSALYFADIPKFNLFSASLLTDEPSPVKSRRNLLESAAVHPVLFPRLNSRSLPDAGRHSLQNSDQLSDRSSRHSSIDRKADQRESIERDSEIVPNTETRPLPPHTPAISTVDTDAADSLGRITSTNANNTSILSTNLSPLPLREASSPLRPSQWVTRGGLLSSPRHQTRTPDRFISSRRPSNKPRESFELNKPAERLAAQDGRIRDPFSRRLHRSVRLNEELRSLRETHSVLTGRAQPNRRAGNPAIRRGSVTVATRQISAGAVWNVGGGSAFNETVLGVSNGRGGMLGSGTHAPLYTSMFLGRSDPEAELEAYERRLALALDIDQSDRILEHTPSPSSSLPTSSSSTPSSPALHTRNVWRDSAWNKDVLDAPQLRDDYYCSLLAYSHTAKCLAVGLGNFVHLWSERKGVDTPESLNLLTSSTIGAVQHVTSLTFSSTQGGQAILAVGRADGRIALWSPFDPEPRFDATQPKPISCVAFRPTMVKRTSRRDRAMTVPTEELLIGDEAGHVYFYSVEWPSETESALFGWNGAMTLLARMTIHTQQICGLSWSVDGEVFATGGNDNACFLFETKKVLQSPNNAEQSSPVDVRYGPDGESIYSVASGRGNIIHVPNNVAKHKWELNAAVKAIAFCPWQRGLLAVGGGSNDRCIHFYHTISGACLATIDCAAQVTSLIWSQTRREIAATFGFAQPEHPYRIAVFAWPSCEQVVSVPWFDENRALYAVAYPGSADPASTAESEGSGRTASEDSVWWRRSVEEGCIVVAASDAAIRFHEIWTGGKKGVGRGPGQLGGSDILESMHGIERGGGAVIR